MHWHVGRGAYRTEIIYFPATANAPQMEEQPLPHHWVVHSVPQKHKDKININNIIIMTKAIDKLMQLSKPPQINLGQIERFPVHTNIKLVSLIGFVWQDNHQDPTHCF